MSLSVSAGDIVSVIKKVGAFIDTMAVKGVDRSYIESPEKPWQVILSGNINQSDLKMTSVIDGKNLFDDSWGDIDLESRIKTGVSAYAGFWVGYRGYGVGYSRNLSHEKGSVLRFGATGSSYGVNLRIYRFETDEPPVHFAGYMPEWEEVNGSYLLDDPIRVRALTLDAFYLFNSKRFSHCAAYDMSVIQRRSAGSLMAGVRYHHSTIKYDEGLNADFVMYMNDIGKMKHYQVGAGVGYAYNFVPCKGLLVSAMAMPLLTFFNRIDAWRYHSNFRDIMKRERENPSDEEEIDFYADDLELTPIGKEVKYSTVTLNIDARLSVTYNIGDWFVSANGQFNRFNFKYDVSSGTLTDWYVNACIGLRL